MNKTLLLNTITFLKRVPLEGDEAFAYVELMQSLQNELKKLETLETEIDMVEQEV